MKITESALSAVHLSEVVPPDALSAAIADGLVRVQVHPSLPLRIFNYTELAVHSRTWNAATTVCRGLIQARASIRPPADRPSELVERMWPDG